jgi:hypothetical protein
MRWLLAMSTRIEMNSLACVRYRPEMDKQHVLRLKLLGSGESPRTAHAGALQTPALFGSGVTHGSIVERLDADWTIRTTPLTETFGWPEFRARFEEPPLALFALTDRDELHFYSEKPFVEPKPGWRVTALVGRSVTDVAEGSTESGAERESGA